MSTTPESSQRWYEGITRYQWMVLVLASLGWIFDVFEGQIFISAMDQAMPELTGEKKAPALPKYTILAAFMLGGALGGVVFGMVSDRIGRKKTLSLTILMYSFFTCFSAFAQSWWQMAGLRFLVAMGVGGEWAVASTLVAEVFPKRARARTQSIFHASSVLGTYLAVAAGMFVVANKDLQFTLNLFGQDFTLTSWRIAFLLGVIPALLIIWIRISLREPERWVQAKEKGEAVRAKTGRLSELFTPALKKRTFVGVTLAAVAMATFWGIHVFGKDMMKAEYQQEYKEDLDAKEDEGRVKAAEASVKRGEMLGMFLVTTGGGLGLLFFGPFSERVGRRGAFLWFNVGGLIVTFILFQLISGWIALCIFLPVFGFWTLGMHAGAAVYFPELFPTHLRGTGAGFCFNIGRILAVPFLLLKGVMIDDFEMTPSLAASILSVLFLAGVMVSWVAPETRDEDLPE